MSVKKRFQLFQPKSSDPAPAKEENRLKFFAGLGTIPPWLLQDSANEDPIVKQVLC